MSRARSFYSNTPPDKIPRGSWLGGLEAEHRELALDLVPRVGLGAGHRFSDTCSVAAETAQLKDDLHSSHRTTST